MPLIINKNGFGICLGMRIDRPECSGLVEEKPQGCICPGCDLWIELHGKELTPLFPGKMNRACR